MWPVADQTKWLVADPSTSPLLNQSFQLPKVGGTTEGQHPVRNGLIDDPFFDLPLELVHEIMGYLSCREVFRWRQASVAIGQAHIPSRAYRRFVRDEYAFLPQLRRKTLGYNLPSEDSSRNWKQVFEYASRACRLDDGLRSRRRIWKAILPIADELVETSATNVEQTCHMDHEIASRTGVKRTYVGAMSGAEGRRHTSAYALILEEPKSAQSSGTPSKELTVDSSDVINEPRPQKKYVGCVLFTFSWTLAMLLQSIDHPMCTSSCVEHTVSEAFNHYAFLALVSDSCQREQQQILGPSKFVQAVREVVVWLDPRLYNICGLELCFVLEKQGSGPPRSYRKTIGTPSTLRECYTITQPGLALIGFNVCYYNACLQGLQLVFQGLENELPVYPASEIASERYGSWDGPARRLVVTPGVSRLAGFTAFISNTNKFETFAILEEAIPDADAQETSSETIPLSHQEAAMWTTLPPNNVDMLERAGPFFGNWATVSAEWHLFETHSPVCITGRKDIDTLSSLEELQKIEGFWHDDYLSGLSFTYRNYKTFSSRKLGACEGTAMHALNLKEGDKIIAVIIGHGSLGIHSIQVGQHRYPDHWRPPNCGPLIVLP